MKKSKTLFVTFSLLFAAMGGIISSRDDEAIGAIVELYPTDDTTIRQNRPYSNYGDTEQLSVRNECGGYPLSGRWLGLGYSDQVRSIFYTSGLHNQIC